MSLGADVTIRAGEASLNAHAFVLALRSPVFRAMLIGRAEMQEARTGVVDLEVDAYVAKRFLEFLYTDELGPEEVPSDGSIQVSD